MPNFRTSHESRAACLGADRFAFPENHTEADNRLSWVLGRLDKAYGDNARYVHLIRDREATAASFVRRYNGDQAKSPAIASVGCLGAGALD